MQCLETCLRSLYQYLMLLTCFDILLLLIQYEIEKDCFALYDELKHFGRNMRIDKFILSSD